MRSPKTARELVPDLVAAARAELGEGPVWDAATRRLVWVDILGRRVHRFDPADDTDAVVLETPSHVGAVAPRRDGGLVLALVDGFWLLDPGATTPRPHRTVDAGRPETRFNDGKVDGDGRFWAGTMAYDLRPGAGSLYRLDGDGQVETMLDGVTISNGLAWSDDRRTLYYIDTPTRQVDAFDCDPTSGAISGRRTFVQLSDDQAGSPDGMTIDSEGALWVALWDGWAVHRYLPSGTLAAVVRMPVARPTSCAFGGPDLGDLYITSARSDLSAEELAAQPAAGGLFRVRPGTTGRPSTPFAG
jgi:sugar lactone lactonase YvrE